MLTHQILFGMNLLSLAGFALMGISLTLSRQKRLRAPAAFTMMGAGTALLFAGIYAVSPS